jgi:hypothetical protein
MKKANSTILYAIILLVVASLGLGGFALARFLQPSGKLVNEVPQSEIEARYGIHFTQIAMTADGGLVDIRYTVVSSETAMETMMDGANNPVLIASNGLKVSTATTMSHKIEHEVGKSYWMIYYNTKNALHPGSVIDVQVGDLLIKNVKIQ